MSDINSRGDFVHGVGGAFVNLNNVALFPGGVIGWMDDDTIACANGDANWTAFKYHVPTGTKTPLSDPLIGANSGYAGGGHAAWMWVPPPGSTDPHRGLNSTTGFTGVDLGVSGMGPNAEIAYKVFHSTGPHWVRELDGSEWLLTNGDAYAVQLLGGGLALWLEYGQSAVFVRGIPQPRTRLGPIWFPRACFVQGRWWLGYQTPNDGTIAHPFDDPDHGYRFTPAGQDAWPMFRTLADGRLCCVWSDHIDEQAGRMTRVVKDVLTDPVEAFAPPDPEEPEEPDLPDPEEPEEPEPEPEEPRMIYFAQAKQSGDAKEITSRMKVWGEKVPHTSGGFGVKKPNGKFATLTPSGQWEERDAILGHWEVFFDAKPAGTMAPRQDPQVVFYLETYEG